MGTTSFHNVAYKESVLLYSSLHDHLRAAKGELARLRLQAADESEGNEWQVHSGWL